GERRPWSSLSAQEQLDYIIGYAEGVDGGVDITNDFHAAGYVRGRNARSAKKLIDSGRAGDRGFAIVDSDASGRRLVVHNVRRLPERGGYEAEVATAQYRRHHGEDYSRSVPWNEGARVFFTVDALGAS